MNVFGVCSDLRKESFLFVRGIGGGPGRLGVAGILEQPGGAGTPLFLTLAGVLKVCRVWNGGSS